jgi:hypothetical protein
MTKFRVNDVVRVIAHPSAFFDEVGTIESIDGTDYPFEVVGIDYYPLSFAAHELVLAENGVVGA